MQEVSLFCGGNFADDATLVLLSYKQQGKADAPNCPKSTA